MVLTILWQVYMFLSACESIQACQMMELLGQVMAKLLEAKIYEEPSFGAPYPFAKVTQSMQGKNNGEEEIKVKRSKEENRGQQLQSSLALLEHFPKSTFYILYTISNIWKSRIQRFKPCTIWSCNEEDMAFGSQLLQVVCSGLLML